MCLTEVVHFMDSCSFAGPWITLMNSFFLFFPLLIFFCLQFCDVFSDSGRALRSLSSRKWVPASLLILLSFSWDEKPTRVGAGFSEILWWRQHWWRRTKWGGPGTPIRSHRLFTSWVAIGVWRTADLCLWIWIQRSFWNFYFFFLFISCRLFSTWLRTNPDKSLGL